MTTYYILRHAEKEVGDFFNQRLRHQDQPISQKGRLESQKLYPYFSDKQIEALYVSEYQRTWQTIEYVAQQQNLIPVIDSRLNEIDNGCLDGEQSLPDRRIIVFRKEKAEQKPYSELFPLSKISAACIAKGISSW
jgi:broad specificity phosphatase PhoE